MTLKEFKTLLDIHGADLGKWPHDRRVTAMAFLDQSEAARQAFAEAADLDAALRSGGPELDPAHRSSLVDGIMDSIDGEQEPTKATDTATERQSGAVDDTVNPPPGWLRPTGATAGLAGGNAGRTLPSAGMLAISMAIGILCGVAVMQISASQLSVSPVYGGVELWVK